MITILKSKLQQVIVTQSSFDYEGSITIDLDLMDAAGLYPYELVHVNNPNGHRDITYILPGERGTGIIGINGALSKHHAKGDKVHVLAFHHVSDYQSMKQTIRNHDKDYEAGTKKPIIIYTDENNKVK